MARKLNSEEEAIFTEALRQSEGGASEVSSEKIADLIDTRRDSALALSPALDLWWHLETVPAARQ